MKQIIFSMFSELYSAKKFQKAKSALSYMIRKDLKSKYLPIYYYLRGKCKLFLFQRS